MSDKSSNHPARNKGENQNGTEESASQQDNTRIPRPFVPLQILPNLALERYNDVTEDLLHGGRLDEEAPAIHHDGARYILLATAKEKAHDELAWQDAKTRQESVDRGNANDRTAKRGSRDEGKSTNLKPIEEGNESEDSAVGEVNRFLRQNAAVDRSMGTRLRATPSARQATNPSGHFHTPNPPFHNVRVATEEERLATAIAMSLEPYDEECTHRSVDALIMQSTVQRQAGMVAWPVDPVAFPPTCDICEKVMKTGDGYKQCRMCQACRCRTCEWTLRHSE